MNKKNVLLILAAFVAGGAITATWLVKSPTPILKNTIDPQYLIQRVEFTPTPLNSQGAMVAPATLSAWGEINKLITEAGKLSGQARINYCCKAVGGTVFTRDGFQGCQFDPGLGSGGMALLDMCINEIDPEATV